MSEQDWTKRLKLRHLHVFAAVAKHKSLTAAAVSLRVTQPALSKWLRELEAQIGTTLFERGRQLRLRSSGEALLRYVERVTGELDRARDEMKALRRGEAGSVRVGTVFGPASVLVPRAVAMLKAAAPAVAVFVYEDTLDRLLPRLESGELDIIACRLEERALNAAVACEALYHDPASVVTRSGHPLADKKRVTWQDAYEFEWILPTPGAPMRLRIEEAFAQVGLPLPSRRIESVSPIANLMLLRETDYLAVMSSNLARQFEAAGLVRCLPLAVTQGLGPVGMLWLEGSAARPVERFLDCMRAQAAKLNKRLPLNRFGRGALI